MLMVLLRRGNVLLQYFGIGKKEIDFVADRNPKKNNHYTPGTKIKIISEKKSRKNFTKLLLGSSLAF